MRKVRTASGWLPKRTTATGSWLELPANSDARVRPIGTVSAGMDRRLEMLPQGRVVPSDASHRPADGARGADARSFSGRRRASIPAAQADGAGELAGQEVDLLLRPRRPLRIVESLGFGQLLPQLAQPLRISRLRLRVEMSTRIAETANAQVGAR